MKGLYFGVMATALASTALAVAACGGGSSTSDGADGSSGQSGGSSTGGSGGGTSAGGTGGSSASGGSTSTGGTAGTGGSAGGGTGGAAATGGSAGAATGGAAGANGGSAGMGTGGSAGGGNNCLVDCANRGLRCCGDRCVNPGNDVDNCGRCGNECTGRFPFCDAGTCGAPTCSAGTTCGGNEQCCGGDCCTTGELCCDVPGGPVGGLPRCMPPVMGTCPQGCPNCPCASPSTPIATPDGERPISEISPGDLVYSVEGEGIEAVPVAQVQKNPVSGHYVLRVKLASGVTLEITGAHPLADGRPLSSLSVGNELDGVVVLDIEQVPYQHDFTYDILPASDTGTYFAGGVRIGSTMSHR